MVLPLMILAAAAAQAVTPARPQPLHGRTFISPMGEPFRVPAGQDGLTVWFAQADQNHDGSITLDELKQDAQRFFMTLDTNGDGEIDPDELERYENVVAPEVRGGTGWGGVGDRVNDEASGGGALGLLSIPEPVAAADSNFNRGVSALEFEQAATKRFPLLDTNGDGRLTLDELAARRAAQRAFSRKPMKEKDTTPPPSAPPDESDPDAG